VCCVTATPRLGSRGSHLGGGVVGRHPVMHICSHPEMSNDPDTTCSRSLHNRRAHTFTVPCQRHTDLP